MNIRVLNYNNFIIWLAIVFLTYLGFVTFNRIFWGTTEEDEIRVPFSQILTGEPIALEQDDERIINYIWKHKILEEPSTEPYNLTNPSQDPSHGQSENMRKILGNMTNGYFVEVGGFDGETHSNTIYMERFLNWTGLMVEGDPTNYASLKQKHRKSYTANACLSIKPYPHQATFFQYGSGGKIVSDREPSKGIVKIQCFPLFSFLTALKVKKIDFFSLDVEGSELRVLKTIPFDRVFIRTLTVEYAHMPEGKQALIDFMVSKNYKSVMDVVKPGVEDLVFVHRDAFNPTVINNWK